MARFLIAGCGNVGSALGMELVRQDHSVVGLKRSPPSVNSPANNSRTIHYIQGDLTRNSDLARLDTDFDQVVYIVTPGAQAEAAYRDVFEVGLANLLNLFAKKNPQASFTITSSTSIYAQDQGEWVDESSETKPASYRGRYQQIAENQVLAYGSSSTVVRFSGIYGPGRFRLLEMAKRGAEIQREPPAYTNRIHRDDCVGVLNFLIGKKMAGEKLHPVYLASDDNPAPIWEVVSWLAAQLKVEPPKEKAVSQDVHQNKRCSNQRLRDSGYLFKYPDYRLGYAGIIQDFLSLKHTDKIAK